MAVVGAAITAAWTWFGSSAAGALVGRLLLSTAVSAISTAIQKQLNKPQQPGIKTEYTTDGGDKPMSFVLGWYATDGHMVCPPMSHGKFDDWSNAYLTYVIDLGNVPGAQIDKVIIDDTEVAFEAADQSIPQGGAVPLGRPREWYIQQGIDPDNPNAPAPTRPVITPGRPIITEKYKGKVWLRYHDGTQTEADPYLLQVYGPGTGWAEKSERPWTADMVGVGTCYAVLTFRYSTRSFNGLPRCRFVMQGTPLYDPRKDGSVGGSGTQRWDDPATWATTTNGMVLAYNVLRGIPVPGGPIWGYGVPASGLPHAEWTAAMTAADQLVDAQPRWRAAWEVSTSEEPASVLDEVLKVCCAKVAESAGIWRVRVGPPAAPVLFFSDEDLILEDDATATPFPGLEATFNAIHATYPEPAQLWRPKDAPPRYNAAWEASDQGRRLVAELNMPACPWGDQVQRVMRAYIEEERRFRRHVISLPPEAEALEPLDVIAWTSSEQGYEAKLFEVQEVGEATDTMRVTVSVVEVDPADYDWQPGFRLPNPIARVTRPTPGPVVPSYFTAEGIALTASDGRPRRAAARLRWGGWALEGITAVRWEIRRTGQSEAARGLMGDPEAGETLVTAGILPATGYEARISFLADGEREVAWTTWTPFTTPDIRLTADDIDTTPPDTPPPPTLTSTLTSLTASWAAEGADVAWSELEYTESGGNPVYAQTGGNRHTVNGTLPGTAFSVRRRRVDRVGNKSNWSLPATHTTAKDTTPPAVPTGIEVTGTFNAFVLKWNRNTEADFAYYELAHGTATNPTAIIASPLSSSFILGNQPEKTLKYFRLRAVDTSGNRSAWSANASATTLGAALTTVTTEQLKGLIDATSFANGVQPIRIWTGNALPSSYQGDTISWGGKLHTWDGTKYVQAARTDDLKFENITGALAKSQVASDLNQFILSQGQTALADKQAAEAAAALANDAKTQAAASAAAASGSASSATGSASTASTKATEASASAGAAAASVVQAKTGAARVLPAEITSEFWRHVQIGIPGDQGLSRQVIVNPGYVTVPATDTGNIHFLSQAALPYVAGRTYRVTIGARVAEAYTGVRIYVVGLKADYSASSYSNASSAIPLVGSSDWQVSLAEITLPALADSTQFRIGIAVLESTLPDIDLKFILIDDVTSEKSAAGSASAAASSASAAEASKTAAAQSASAAQTSATTASTKAGEASTSAGQAAQSKTDAAGSASSAATHATNAANSATTAGQKATAASGSASTASTKATEASQAAKAAAGSATTASTKAGEASTSASQASASANNAAGSASTAATHATNAANSATTAGQKADAASTSASTASTKATEAGQSATSASGSANTATTQAGIAVAKAGEAASSATSAAGSASDASSYAQLAALALSGGMAKNPTFMNWTGASPPDASVSGNGQGTATKVAGKYGNAVELNVTGVAAQGPSITLAPATLRGATNPAKVLVTVEAELLTGPLSGLCLAVGWHDTSTRWVNHFFASKLTLGAIQTFQVVIDRPATVVSASGITLQLIASQAPNRALGKVKIHRLDIQDVVADSFVDQQIKTKATLDGLAEASYVMRVKAGGASAGFEMVAASDPKGPASAIRMNADEILLNGSVQTPHLDAGAVTAQKLAIGFGGNFITNSDFKAGLTGWAIAQSGAAGAETTLAVQAPGSGDTYSGADYPTLRLRQDGASATGYADLRFWGVRDSTGAPGFGWPVKPGDWIEVSAQLSTHRCTAELRIEWRDASGANVGYSAPVVQAANPGSATNPDQWPRIWVKGLAPTNSAYAVFHLRKKPTESATTSFVFVHKPMETASALERTEPTAYAPGSFTLLDGAGLLTDSVTARAVNTVDLAVNGLAHLNVAYIKEGHVSGTLSAAILRAGTALASSLTVDGTALATVQSRAADPAARINAHTTQIDPGKIVISGSRTLADWRYGADLTQIDGGNLAANTVRANALEIGSRNVAIENIEFEYNKPGLNQLSWTAGKIRFPNDAGQQVAVAIPAGGATWTGGVQYVVFHKAASALAVTTDPTVAFHPDRLILATYQGAHRLNATYGRTIIDGNGVKTDALLVKNQAQMGEAVVDTLHIAGRAITAPGFVGASGAITFASSTSWVEIASAAILRAPMEVWLKLTAQVDGPSGAAVAGLRVVRNPGAVIVAGEYHCATGPGGWQTSVSIEAIDSDTSGGLATYVIQGRNVQATARIGARVLSYNQFKR